MSLENNLKVIRNHQIEKNLDVDELKITEKTKNIAKLDYLPHVPTFLKQHIKTIENKWSENVIKQVADILKQGSKKRHISMAEKNAKNNKKIITDFHDTLLSINFGTIKQEKIIIFPLQFTYVDSYLYKITTDNDIYYFSINPNDKDSFCNFCKTERKLEESENKTDVSITYVTGRNNKKYILF